MDARLYKEHSYTIKGMVFTPDDGFILGNGDLSVSIYQKPGQIVWRFGKGDVWDRRHMTDCDPRPLTMDELRNGLENEGWSCPAYGGKIEALKGTSDIKRVREVLTRPNSQVYPYPMPKPVGELSLHWPGDLQNPEINQQLYIEKAKLEVTYRWPDGERLQVECFIHPTMNVLVVKWKLEGFDPGSPQPFFKTLPVWLSLYRWADPDIEEFSNRWKAEYGCPMFEGFVTPKAVKLPPPEVIEVDNVLAIQQQFYPDALFPKGFKYILGCITSLPSVEKFNSGNLKDARITLHSEPPMTYESVKEFMMIDKLLREGLCDYPEENTYEGWVVIPVTTSSDKNGPENQLQQLKKEMQVEPSLVLQQWQQECETEAKEFWSKSNVQLAEKTIEDLWYQTLHISRSIYRKDTIPPGLFIPSTISDYSLWKGDYHTNYNIQQAFWGFLTANHPELLESYFTIMNFMNQIGKKIAKDYCGTRGTFIQICGYPIVAEDDTYATGAMSRMPYMTGWAPELYWLYFLHTGDIEFLRKRAYPFIRDCALFYTDFLQLGDDGKYHAFPSCWGEEGYDGTKEKNVDALQTIDYAESVMTIAKQAAEILNEDEELRDEWQKRLDNLAKGLGENEWRPLPEAFNPNHRLHNLPAFRPGENYRFPSKFKFEQRWWGWIDKLTISLIRDIRGGQFDIEKDFSQLTEILKRWKHPNGLIWPMPIRFYGRPGGWTEAFGIIAPLQEMLLQSWDEKIAVFPSWPKHIDAEFNSLAAKGAFLVSAKLEKKEIKEINVKSLKGCHCLILNPWFGHEVQITSKSGLVMMQNTAILSFDTVVEDVYYLQPIDC